MFQNEKKNKERRELHFYSKMISDKRATYNMCLSVSLCQQKPETFNIGDIEEGKPRITVAIQLRYSNCHKQTTKYSYNHAGKKEKSNSKITSWLEGIV